MTTTIMASSTGGGTAAARWMDLDSNRQTVLTRARTCANLTIPALLPPLGATENDHLQTPYQSVGARAVNNLASKLMLTLYRPNSPYFKLVLDPMFAERLKQETGDESALSKAEAVFAKLEEGVMKYHEVKADRVPLFNGLRHLIVTGNVLLFQDRLEEHKLRVFRLDQYVCRRNPSGRPMEIIVREYITSDEVPKAMRQLIGQDATEKPIELYTYAKRNGNKWLVFQEIAGQVVPDSMGSYDEDAFPFLPLTWTLHPGEHYGRGHVEENLGDFISLEGLRKSFLEGAAALAKLVFLVNPSGTTNKRAIEQAPNGGFAAGRAEDITTLQADKMPDFQFVQSEIIRLEASLSRAFLMAESVQRDAERVTAEEIRMMASDLDDTLGGIYTLLAQQLQAPLLILRMAAMRAEKRLPPIPPNVQYSITTGFDALGRGHEVVKLQQFLQLLAPFGEETMRQMVGIGEYARRVAAGIGLDPSGLVPTDEELAQLTQQAQIQAIIHQVTPIIAKALADQGALQPPQGALQPPQVAPQPPQDGA